MTKFQKDVVDRLSAGETLAASLPGQGLGNYRWRDKNGVQTKERAVTIATVAILRNSGVVRCFDEVKCTVGSLDVRWRVVRIAK